MLLFKLRSRQSLASAIINDDSREVYAMSGLLKRAIATGNEYRHAKLAALCESSFVSKSGIETLLKTVRMRVCQTRLAVRASTALGKRSVTL